VGHAASGHDRQRVTGSGGTASGRTSGPEAAGSSQQGGFTAVGPQYAPPCTHPISAGTRPMVRRPQPRTCRARSRPRRSCRPRRRRAAPRRVARADLPPSRAAHPPRWLAAARVLVAGPEGSARRPSCGAPPQPRSAPAASSSPPRGRRARAAAASTRVHDVIGTAAPRARRAARPALCGRRRPAARHRPTAAGHARPRRTAYGRRDAAPRVGGHSSSPESVDPRLRAPTSPTASWACRSRTCGRAPSCCVACWSTSRPPRAST
jgi:hypothetical protein